MTRDVHWNGNPASEMFTAEGFVRPDVEQLTEARRPHVPPPLLADRQRRAGDAVAVILIGIVVVVFAALFFSSASAAGPGCPIDPHWNGWCSDIPGAV